MTPEQLFEWATSWQHSSNGLSVYLTNDCKSKEQRFHSRTQFLEHVNIILLFHCQGTKFLLKCSDLWSRKSHSPGERPSILKWYNDFWWLACVNEDTDVISISLLHSHEPSQSFRYCPPIPDILANWRCVDPRVGKGHTHSLTRRASRAATENVYKLVQKVDELNR